MIRRFQSAIVVSILVAAGAGARGAAQQQQDLPRFRSSVELTSLDVGVFDDRGRPVTDLKPGDFVVRIDGDPRRVVSADWVALEAPPGPPPPEPPEGYSTNENATGGRLIVLVIDQPNIRFGGTMVLRKAMYGLIDRLEPADRVAVLGIGPGSRSTSFTANHERLKKAIEGMVGQYSDMTFHTYSISLSEALDISRQMPTVLDTVAQRECVPPVGGRISQNDYERCMVEVEQQAMDIARTSRTDGMGTVTALRDILAALRAIDAPKTLIVVSEGFVVGEEIGAVTELGSLSAAARTSIYALKLDDESYMLPASQRGMMVSTMNDRLERGKGLEILAASSRGSLFSIIGTGEGVFEQIGRELSGYYLLGVESGPADKDGKAHPIRVDVSRRGVSVRSRRALLASTTRAPRNAREAVVAALQTPLPMSGLPLRIATYSLQGPEAGKVQLLIHADVGTDYSASRLVTLGYLIENADGRVVESQVTNARLQPIMTGVPSSLQFAAGASVPPGDYTVKLAVAEGDRVGTVEHTVRAGVVSTGPLNVSDLMVGGPVATGDDPLQPTVGYTVVFGVVHGYMEAYGAGADGLTAKYEVAADDQGPALLNVDVRPRMAGGSRAIFTRVVPVRQLPPGKYVLRATLSAGGNPIKTSTRAFEVAAPAVLMTSASSSSSLMNMPGDVYLPVSETMLSRQFNRSEASRRETIQAFRAHVPASALAAFDKGVQYFNSGSYAEAEAALKSGINPDTESSALIAYLAAVFAASGHDLQAAGAWQTALIDEPDLPQIYEWLVDTLIRIRDLSTARSMLEEAIAKWPSDVRFARPMALVYATFGQGAQAVRSIERHLAVHKDNVEDLFMAVEWIYQLRAAGASAKSPAEDTKLARTYADAYTKARGPQAALVRQWMAFLENKK